MKYLLFFLLLLSFTIEKDSEKKIFEIEEFFELIYQTNITKQDSTKLINNLKKILERYVYLDIAKLPPQPSGGHITEVDLIKELSNVNQEERPLYDFYRDVKIIIDKCQDLHLNIDLKREFSSGITLENSLLFFPLILFIADAENKVVASVPNSLFPFEESDSEIFEIITRNQGENIISINGQDPIDYIQNFNGDFRKLKNPHADFLRNQNSFMMTQLLTFPFNKEELTNIKIVYDNKESVELNFKVLFGENLLGEYFEVPKTEGNNNIFKNNIPFLKPKLNIVKAFNNKKLTEVKWDYTFEENNIKCKIDNNNKVNVIFQSTFLVSDLNRGLDFLDRCFNSFYQNSYPIVVIEAMNGGGYVDLADRLISYINLNKTIPLYLSVRYNDQVKENIAPIMYFRKVGTCDAITGKELFKLKPKEDFYGTNDSGEEIKHQRTQIVNLSTLGRRKIYDFRKNAKNIRKPTEIIIFTDGFSYSATSFFIKETQLKGGAIIVGYGGNPKYEENFDASQSPSPVLDTNTLDDKLSKEIKNLGFSFSYPFGESFEKDDYENETDTKIPLEYQVNEIDLRVPIYNGYNDLLYDNFIMMANQIFKMSKSECNPDNKKLLLINEECTFEDIHLHGGYKCSDDGTWSSDCSPSYCDNGYFFDEINEKCIEEEICDKIDKKKNKNYLIISILFLCAFILFLVIFIILSVIGGINKKNYLLIPIVLFLILFAVMLIVYLKSEVYN